MSNPNQFCIESDADATWAFGRDICINNKYLVLSDLLRNKVFVYTPNGSGRWQRDREILPPTDLDLSFGNYGSAFANGIELDGDVLAIYATTINPEWFREESYQSQKDEISKYFRWRYLTNLRTRTPLKQIDLLVEPELNSDRVRFNLLRKEKIEQFILPNMGKAILRRKVALDDNLLLVGYSSPDYTGGAYLFDLTRPEVEPLELAIENTALGGTVAVSQQFAVVGFDGVNSHFYQGNARDHSHMTLIRNLKNGATNVIDSFGKVSLSGNILAVMNLGNDDIESQFIEVFRLDKNAEAHLITKRTVYQGKVQQGFLFTKSFNASNKVCIEPLPSN